MSLWGEQNDQVCQGQWTPPLPRDQGTVVTPKLLGNAQSGQVGIQAEQSEGGTQGGQHVLPNIPSWINLWETEAKSQEMEEPGLNGRRKLLAAGWEWLEMHQQGNGHSLT